MVLITKIQRTKIENISMQVIKGVCKYVSIFFLLIFLPFKQLLHIWCN